MRGGDRDALVTGDRAAHAVIEGFECEGVVNRGIWEPRGDRSFGVLKPYFIFKVADMIGRISDNAGKWAVIEDAVDRSSVAIDVSKLSKTILRNIILRNSQRVVIEAKFRHC